MTRSACLPGSIEPISSPSPSAWAALIVTAASASSGRHPERQARDRHRQRQARRRRRARVEVGPDRDRDAALDERPGRGAWWSFMRNQVVAGRSVATTGRPDSRRPRPAASIPASDGVARWSADERPDLGGELRAAATVPARRRGVAAASRRPPPRSGSRRHWSAREDAVLAEDVGEAGPALGGDAGSCSSMSCRTYASAPSGRSRNSAGTACAPSQVGTTSIGPSRPSRWATSSRRSSVGRSRP